MYYTTGFSREQITDLCAAVNRKSVHGKNAARPPSLGLFLSVVVTLTYLRRNRVQHELAETYGVSQSTISRAIAAITPMLGEALADCVPTADELDPRAQYIMDGTVRVIKNSPSNCYLSSNSAPACLKGNGSPHVAIQLV